MPGVSMAQNRAPDTALTRRAPPPEPWRDPEWQKLWLVLKSRPWTSLALVPAGSGAGPDFTLTVAVTLARVGILHLGTPIHVADATRIPLGHLEQFAEDVRRLNQEGDLVLLALPPLDESPVAISLARSASTALLCVLLEEMSSSEAKKTVDRIGQSQFIGCVVFHPGQLSTSIVRTTSPR